MNIKQIVNSECWSDQRALLKKYLMVIFFVVIVLTILMLTGMMCVFSDQCNSPKRVRDNFLFKQVNKSANPCKEFYNYTCRNQIKATLLYNRVPYMDDFYLFDKEAIKKMETFLEKITKDEDDEEKEKNETDKDYYYLYRLVKGYYESCINDNATLNNHKQIKALFYKKALKWMEVVASLRKNGFTPDIFVGVNVVEFNGEFVLELGKPSILGTQWTLLLKPERNYTTYYQLMVAVATAFGFNKTSAEEEFWKVLEFEKQLSIIWEKSKDEPQLLTLNELRNKSKIDWLKYINIVLSKDAQRTENQTVLVRSLEYLEKFEKIISDNNKNSTLSKIISSYGLWRATLEKINFLSESLQNKYYKLYDVKTLFWDHDNNNNPREQRCIFSTFQSFPHIFNLFYTNQINKTKLKNLAERIRDYLLPHLYKIDDHIGERIKEINFTFATPNVQIIRRFYGNHRFNSKSSLNNSLQAYKLLLDNRYKMLLDDTNSEKWAEEENMMKMPIRYDLPTQTIHLSGAIIQKAYLYNNEQAFFNFGSLGTVLAQEILKGFDSKSKEQNLKFIIRNENTSRNKNQKPVYTDEIGGIQLAHSAYITWLKYNHEEGLLKLTPKQLFWVSALQNWCAAYKHDVWKSLQYLIQFKETFKCKK